MISILIYVKSSYTLSKFIIDLVKLAVKCSLVSGDRDTFMQKCLIDDLGFAAALQANLKLGIQFLREGSYAT